MGLNTLIDYAHHSHSFWHGCTKVSDGCKFCYMYAGKRRWGQDPTTIVRSIPTTFNAILNRKKYLSGQRIFVCSWSDFFIEDADPWRDDAFTVMRQRPDLIFMIFTKRIERAEDAWPDDWGPNGWPNVWLIASTENQEQFKSRVPILLETRAALRGISVEPMLEGIDVDLIMRDRSETDAELAGHDRVKAYWADPLTGVRGVLMKGGGVYEADPNIDRHSSLDWVIVGAESGPGARPMDLDWVRAIRDECAAADVPFYLKQFATPGGTKIKTPELDGIRHVAIPEGYSRAI